MFVTVDNKFHLEKSPGNYIMIFENVFVIVIGFVAFYIFDIQRLKRLNVSLVWNVNSIILLMLIL